MQGCLNELMDPQPDEDELVPEEQTHNKKKNSRNKKVTTTTMTAADVNKYINRNNHTTNNNINNNDTTANNNNDGTGFFNELFNPQPDPDVAVAVKANNKKNNNNNNNNSTAKSLLTTTDNNNNNDDTNDGDGADAAFCLQDLAACEASAAAIEISRALMFSNANVNGIDDIEQQKQQKQQPRSSTLQQQQNQVVEAIYYDDDDFDSSKKNKNHKSPNHHYENKKGRTTLWNGNEDTSVAYLSECVGGSTTEVMMAASSEEKADETNKNKRNILTPLASWFTTQTNKKTTTLTYTDKVQRNKRKCRTMAALLVGMVVLLVVASISVWQIVNKNSNNQNAANDRENQDSATNTTTTTTLPRQSPIVFYAVSNTPFTTEQGDALLLQMRNLPDDAEFLVHLGNVHRVGDSVGGANNDGAVAVAENNNNNDNGNGSSNDNMCNEWEYQFPSDILQRSPKPVFVVMGDQDSTDCANPEEAYGYWKNSFVGFANKYWQNVPMRTFRPSSRPENFSFEYGGVLFVGLHLTGAAVDDNNNNNNNNEDWVTELHYHTWFTQQAINSYMEKQNSNTGSSKRIVILGHADPADNHNEYFTTLTQFMDDNWSNTVPLLFLNGGNGEWDYTYPFLERGNFVHISVTGGSQEAPLRVQVNLNDANADPQVAYEYERFSYSW